MVNAARLALALIGGAAALLFAPTLALSDSTPGCVWPADCGGAGGGADDLTDLGDVTAKRGNTTIVQMAADEDPVTGNAACYDANNTLEDCGTTPGGAGLGTNLSSTTDDILSSNGTILLGGTGGTNNERLDWDFETTANWAGVSTATGVVGIDLSVFQLRQSTAEMGWQDSVTERDEAGIYWVWQSGALGCLDANADDTCDNFAGVSELGRAKAQYCDGEGYCYLLSAGPVRHLEEFGDVIIGENASGSEPATNGNTFAAAVASICGSSSENVGLTEGILQLPPGAITFNTDDADLDVTCGMTIQGAGRSAIFGTELLIWSQLGGTQGLLVSSDGATLKHFQITCRVGASLEEEMECLDFDDTDGSIQGQLINVGVGYTSDSDHGVCVAIEGPNNYHIWGLRTDSCENGIEVTGTAGAGAFYIAHSDIRVSSDSAARGSGIRIDKTGDVLRQLSLSQVSLQGGLHGIHVDGSGTGELNIQLNGGVYFEQTVTCTDTTPADGYCDDATSIPARVNFAIEDADTHVFSAGNTYNEGAASHDSVRRFEAQASGRVDRFVGDRFEGAALDYGSTYGAGECWAMSVGPTAAGALDDCAGRWEGNDLFANALSLLTTLLLSPVDDDDCTGQQGEMWYDGTDLRFEFCEADSGTPAVLGGAGGSSLWTDGGAITYLTAILDDVAIGGTDSSSPFHFDVSGGVLTINVAGGSINIQAHPTDGGCLLMKEGADDGSNTHRVCAPDSGLTSDIKWVLPDAPAPTVGHRLEVASVAAGVITLQWAAPTPDQVGTVNDGEWCRGGAGGVLDCDEASVPAASVGNGLTDAQVSDDITVGAAGSVDDAAIPTGVARDAEATEHCVQGGLTSPDNTDRIVPGLPFAATLQRLRCHASGGGSITLGLDECDNTGASCVNGGASLTCDGGIDEDASFADAAFDADDAWQFDTGAASGQVDYLSWTVCVDRQVVQ